MAIGSIVLLLAAGMLGTSGESYSRVGNNVASEREGRAVFTTLQQDLSAAVFQKDLLIQSVNPEAWTKTRLGFLTSLPEASQDSADFVGDLCAVSYYIADISHNGKVVRCLMRGFRNSRQTFSALRSDSSVQDQLFAPQGALDEPIAFGVVSFKVIPRVRTNTGALTDWQPNPTTPPDLLEITLTVASRSLMSRLNSTNDWNSSPFLGQSSKISENKDLETFKAIIRFGNSAS